MSQPNNNNLQAPEIEFSDNVQKRHRSGKVWTVIFQFSTVVGIIALATLLFNIVNQSAGYVHYEAKIDPDSLMVDGIPLEEQSKEQLLSVLQDQPVTGRIQ